MSLSTRVSIQWGDREVSEPTDTLVITSPNQHYVDIRCLKNATGAFPFDWVFCGSMISGKNGKTRYTHDIDSRKILSIGPKDEQDVGFTTIDENGDERETGSMFNPDAGKKEKFVEVWRHLDPASSDRVKKAGSDGQLPVCVLATVDGQSVNGKIVRVGQWVQAVAEFDNQTELTKQLACVRANWVDGSWHNQVEFGERVDGTFLLTDYHELVVGQIVKSTDGTEWACIEHIDSMKSTL